MQDTENVLGIIAPPIAYQNETKIKWLFTQNSLSSTHAITCNATHEQCDPNMKHGQCFKYLALWKEGYQNEVL